MRCGRPGSDLSCGRPDCVAGHMRLELRNVAANYPFEKSHRFAGIQPNSGRRDYSRLADSSIARSDDPSSLLRLVLRGSRSVATNDEPTGPGMPSFAWQLNEEQIAAVATYVRNHWADPAPAVSSSKVAKQRSRLGNRSE